MKNKNRACLALTSLPAAWYSFTVGSRPQLILPSVQMPRATQFGPAFSNSTGATLRHSASMRQASSRISHWARVQQRRLKKFSRERTLNVQMIFVSAALGST